MTKEQFEKLSLEEQETLKNKFLNIYPKFMWVRFYKWLRYENTTTPQDKEEV